MLTEQVFTIPGFGKLIVDAVFNRDYPVVQGVVLVTATVYVLLNLLADMLYVLINPAAEGGMSATTPPAVAGASAAASPRPLALAPLPRQAARRVGGLVVIVLFLLVAALRRWSRPTTRPHTCWTPDPQGALLGALDGHRRERPRRAVAASSSAPAPACSPASSR